MDPSPEHLSEPEQQAVAALRAALRPGSTGADEVRALVAETLATAARRRRRRRARAPAAAAAAVVACAVVLLPAVVRSGQDDGATSVTARSATVQALSDDDGSVEPSAAAVAATDAGAVTGAERRGPGAAAGPWVVLGAALVVLVALGRGAARGSVDRKPVAAARGRREGLAVDVDTRWRDGITSAEVNRLHAEAFGTRVHTDEESDWARRVEQHGLGWVTARRGGELVGFLVVVWDGGAHAWLQDVVVAADARHLGIGTALVTCAQREAALAGCTWLHVDFAPDLRSFYVDACGFRPTESGLMDLTEGQHHPRFEAGHLAPG